MFTPSLQRSLRQSVLVTLTCAASWVGMATAWSEAAQASDRVQQPPAADAPSSGAAEEGAPATAPATPASTPEAPTGKDADTKDADAIAAAVIDRALAGGSDELELLRQQPPALFVEVQKRLTDPTAQVQRRVSTLVRHWVNAALDYSMKEEGGLIYHGQFASLKVLGPRGARELLQVLRREDAPPERRRRASIAIGDIGDRTLLPELNKMMDDFLTEDWVIDITGYLMARLGDRAYVDERIADATARADQPETPRYLPSLVAAHTELAQLYYRTEDYVGAIEHYQRKLVLLKALRLHVRPELRSGVEEEIALLHYNLACSFSLSGDVEAAYRALHTAMPHADITVDMVEADGDLRRLRKDVRYPEWLAQLKEREKALPGEGESDTDKAVPEPSKENADS